jgi:hypothetical protein
MFQMSLAPVGHAVAVPLPMVFQVAGVSAVADVFFLLLMFPMSGVASSVASPLFLTSLLLLAL